MKRLTYKYGEEFGDLKVIGQAPSQCGKTRVVLRCVCGNEVKRFLSNLYKPTAYKRSCGCAKRKYGSSNKTKRYPKKIFSDTLQDFYLGRLT